MPTTSLRIRAARAGRGGLAALAAWCLIVPSAGGQTSTQEAPASQPATQPAEAPAPPPDRAATQQAVEPETAVTELRRETIQDRIAQVQASTELAEPVKTELLSLYRQALDQLTVAENWTAKIAELDEGRDRAADLLRDAKARLDQATTRPATQPAPVLAPEETLEELVQKLSVREQDLRTAQDVVRRLDEEAGNRSARKAALPDLQAEANQRLQGIEKGLAAPPPAGTSPQIAIARRTQLLAQKRATEQEIGAYQAELAFYDARDPVLASRRELARIDAAAAQAEVAAWQKVVNQRREAEIERQKQQAERELRQAPGAIRELLEQNAQLAEEWAALGDRIKTLQKEYNAVGALNATLSKEFSDFQKRMQEDPEILAEIIGPDMRRKRSELAPLRKYQHEARALRQELARAARSSERVSEELLELASLDAQVSTQLGRIPATTGLDRQKLEQRIRELYTARRDTLKQMQADYRAYVKDLGDLLEAETRLLVKVAQFQGFIDQHILWLRSTVPLHRARLPEDWPDRQQRVAAVGRALLNDVMAGPAVYGLGLAVLAALLGVRRRLAAALRHLGKQAARPLSDSYGLTVRALACTLLLSLPWALLLWFLGWRTGLAVAGGGPALYDQGQALARALGTTAVVLWTLTLTRHLCRPAGLADVHFRWDTTGLRRARRSVDALTVVLVPGVLVVSLAEQQMDAAYRGSVGRVVFIIGMIALAVFAARLLHPASGVLSARLRKQPSGWLYNLRHLWYPFAVGVPLVLGAASAVGYHYTAVQLAEDLARTVWLILALIVLHALAVRGLFVAQRKLAIERMRKRRAAAGEPASPERRAGEAPQLEETELDLVSVGEQTKSLLRTLSVLGLLIGLWFVWADLLPAFTFLEDVRLWRYTVTVAEATGEAAAETVESVEYITLAHLALAVVLAIATVVLARNIPGLLEITLLQRLPVSAGGRFAVTTLARYVIIATGVIAAFGVIGVGWSKVQWLVAAMTVGLGFGLQEIFANLVSGVLLLFERPIRVGDTVTVGGISGTVTRIHIRATTITDWDRKELVIPNKEFITGHVINWTLSDPATRVIVPVGIAYGSDTQLAEQTLYRVAREAEDVLTEPRPRVLFLGFGDSSLNFELRVFVPHVDHLLGVRHELHMAIDREFRKAGIEIAFPQRDLHLRSVPEALLLSRPAPDLPAEEEPVPAEAAEAPPVTASGAPPDGTDCDGAAE